MSALMDRFMGLPRELRLLVIVVVAVGAFLLWNDVLMATANGWNRDADRLEQKLRDVEESRDLVTRVRGIGPALVSLGELEAPGGEREGRDALTGIIVNVLDGHTSVNNDTYTLGASSRVPRATAVPILRHTDHANQNLVQINVDLTFESTPEDAIAIIADLESRPEIERVNTVRMLKLDGRTMSVALTLDAWVVAGA